MGKIYNYMAEFLLSISLTASILEASHLINDSEVHSLLVEEPGEYIGIIANHDISKKSIIESPDIEKAQVAEFMSFPLIKFESQESMGKAAQIKCDNAILHLAVTENAQMLGALSIHDYYKYLVLKHPK